MTLWKNKMVRFSYNPHIINFVIFVCLLHLENLIQVIKVNVLPRVGKGKPSINLFNLVISCN